MKNPNISIRQTARDFLRPNKYGLKPYLIKDGKKHPFALICPGGAYKMVCSFVEGLPFAQELNKRGYHAIIVYYRTSRKALYPNPQEDLKKAVREVFDRAEEWNLDTNGWSLWGASAGGHLVASYCVDNPIKKPTTLILTYPVITMGEHTHALSKKLLLGPEPTPEMVEKLSIEFHVSNDFPPTFVWCGDADVSVEPINSQMLYEALQKVGVPCEWKLYPGVGHGVGMGRETNAEGWFDSALAFWEKQREQQ